MEYVIRLYRKTSNGPSKRPTKKAWADVLNELALSRTRRPLLEEFFRSGGFHRLTALDAATIKDAARRRRDYTSPEFCYVISESDKGRAKTSPGTVSMSIRQWIDRYFVLPGIIERDEFAITVDRVIE